jgi:hypothetical protein
MNPRNKFCNFLLILLITTVLVRVVYFYVEPDLSTDHITQMAVANNFVSGHGISLAFADTSNPETTIYKTHIQWPPLYPVILGGLYIVTGNHLISTFIFRIAACLILVYLWNRIIKSFIPTISAPNRFLLLSLITISTSVFNSLNTILILPLIFFAISFYFSFVFISKTNNLKSLILASFFSGLMVWSHYSFILPSFSLPFSLLLLYIFRRERQYLFSGIIGFSVIIFLILLLFFYNFYFSGRINYMENQGIWEKGFFLNHLLAIKPMFLDALFKTEYLKPLFNKSILIVLFDVALHTLSFSIFIVVLIVLIKNAVKSYHLKSNIHFFIVASSFVFILLNIVLLSYFSLHYKELPRPGWTHLGEPRYWGNIYLLILLLIVYSISFFESEKIKRSLSIILILFVTLNLSINVIIIKKDFIFKGFDLNSLMEKDQLKDLYLKIESLKSEGKYVIFADTELSVRSVRLAALAGGSIIDPSFLNENVFLKNGVIVFGLFKNENVFCKETNLRHLLKSRSYEIFGSIGKDVILYKLNL